LLGRYGFYPDGVIELAKQAASAEFYNQYSQTSLVVTNSESGQVDKNEFVLPQNNITIDLNGSFTQLSASKDNTYVSLSSQITFNLDATGQCVFTTGEHVPPAEPLEGYWHAATLYNTPGEMVIDSSNYKEYKNECYVVAGPSPAAVYAADPWGARCLMT
jgi:hypothetical protein